MEDLTKHQLVLLLILVSAVTSVVTGIVTVTLTGQAPQPVTQTIQRVIERSTGTVSPELLKEEEAKKLAESAIARDILIQDIVARVSPAVVSVIASKDLPIIEECYINPFPQDDFFGDFFQGFQIPQFCKKGTERRQVSAGSGFFASADGLIITNKHVVSDVSAEYSILTTSGKNIPAKVLARDPMNDMAVLKVEGAGYSFIPLGDSDALKIGQTAIAIGNALGEFQNTVSIGVISGLKRNIIASGGGAGAEELSELIQTDAAINPGNSGGPLLNLRGEVVGLNTATARGAENIGFAIPINSIKRSLAEVKSSGRIIYPYMGIRYAMITPELKERENTLSDFGALVVRGSTGEAAVLPGSPAEKAGIKEGDVILEFAGKKISKENPLGKLIQERKVGDKVTLKILREGQNISLEATLEERKNF